MFLLFNEFNISEEGSVDNLDLKPKFSLTNILLLLLFMCSNSLICITILKPFENEGRKEIGL